VDLEEPPDEAGDLIFRWLKAKIEALPEGGYPFAGKVYSASKMREAFRIELAIEFEGHHDARHCRLMLHLGLDHSYSISADDLTLTDLLSLAPSGVTGWSRPVMVELRGLAPLTLCLQKRLGLSEHLGPIPIGRVLAGQHRSMCGMKIRIRNGSASL
jgi:hypothetical protein